MCREAFFHVHDMKSYDSRSNHCSRILYYNRIPFGVQSIEQLTVASVSSLYLLATAHKNALFLLDTASDGIRELSIPCTTAGLCTELTLSEQKWQLHNAISAAAGAEDYYTVNAGVPVDAFAAHWFDTHHVPMHNADQAASSAILVDIDNNSSNHDGSATTTTLYLAADSSSAASNFTVAKTLFAVRVAANNNTDAFAAAIGVGAAAAAAATTHSLQFKVTGTAALDVPCRVQCMSIDYCCNGYRRLCVAGSNGRIKVFSLQSSAGGSDGDTLPSGGGALHALQLVTELDPTMFNPLDIPPLLVEDEYNNGNSGGRGGSNTAVRSAGSSRTQHNGGGGSGGAASNSTAHVSGRVGGGAGYRCAGAMVVHSAVHVCNDDTRFTNSLKPFDVLYPGSCSESNDGGAGVKSETAVPASSGAGSYDAHSTAAGVAYSTSVVYGMYGARTNKLQSSDYLCFWQQPPPQQQHQDASTASAVSTSRAQLRCTPMPKGGAVQLFISPVRTVSSSFCSGINNISSSLSSSSSSSSSSTAAIIDVNTSRLQHGRRYARSRQSAPPKQSILCLDTLGRLWLHQLHYALLTDFPGPMFPVGYTLIQKVIAYIEGEAELDTVELADGSGSGKGNCGLTKSNNNSTISLGKRSIDAQEDEQIAKKVKHEANMSNSNATERGERVPIRVAVTSRAGGVSTIANLSAINDPALIAALPFTFADDYLRTLKPTAIASTIAAAATAAAASATGGGSALTLAAVMSPARSKPRVFDRAAFSGDFGIGFQQSGWEESKSNANINNVGGEAGAGAGDEQEQEQEREQEEERGGVSVAITNDSAFSGSMDDYILPPTRVQNGDFDSKLFRARATALALKEVVRDPRKVEEKLKQIEAEAVQAVIHQEELRERAKQRQQAKRVLKDREKAIQLEAAKKQREEQARELAELQKQHWATANVNSLSESAQGQLHAAYAARVPLTGSVAQVIAGLAPVSTWTVADQRASNAVFGGGGVGCGSGQIAVASQPIQPIVNNYAN